MAWGLDPGWWLVEKLVIPVCLGLRGFLSLGTAGAKSRTVLDKLGWDHSLGKSQRAVYSSSLSQESN